MQFLQFTELGFTLLGMIETEPGFIIGPISIFFGAIINFIFNITAVITPVGVLGISIIIMNIVVRTLMLPMHFKMYKNTTKMQALKPEMDTIREKYKDAKDPELKRKMNIEIQQLYSKNNVNMFASCLPMLVLMPIFFALMYIMRQSFLFIDDIGTIYSQLSYALIGAFDTTEGFVAVMRNIILPRIPTGMAIEMTYVSDLNRAVAVFTPADWQQIFSHLSGDTLANVQQLYNAKNSMESFLGINLVAVSGLSWPGVVMPVLSAATSFITAWMMQINNKNAAAMPGQKLMLFVFPLMMGFFTINISAGVGLWWTASNVYQIGQQYFITKYYNSEKYKQKEIIKQKNAKTKGDVK